MNQFRPRPCASRVSLKRIVQACGGSLYAGGRRANIPAPGHSRSDRSISLWLQEDRLLVHSFGAADWREALDDLRARGLLDGSVDADGAWSDPVEALSHRARVAAASQLWSEARPVVGSLSERHLVRRGVVAASASPALRHHPEVPLAAYARRGPRLPALLAAIQGPTGELTGVEVTYLDAEGRRADRLRLPRKTLGVVRPSSAVRLQAPERGELLVAEGVFTALSAAARFGAPGWALLSAGALGAWRPPPGVRQVLIAADRGMAGETAAARLRAALCQQGVGARIALPPAPFGDWNEAATGSA